jgi:hypothetical protein
MLYIAHTNRSSVVTGFQINMRTLSGLIYFLCLSAIAGAFLQSLEERNGNKTSCQIANLDFVKLNQLQRRC